MNELRAFIRTYEKLSGESVTDVVYAPAVATPVVKQKFYGGGSVEQFSSRDEIVEAARAVLKNAYPRPMVIGDLYDEVVRMGIRISGNNPKGNFSAKLSPPKDLEFVRDEGRYYRPEKDEASSEEPEAPNFAGGGGSPPKRAERGI